MKYYKEIKQLFIDLKLSNKSNLFCFGKAFRIQEKRIEALYSQLDVLQKENIELKKILNKDTKYVLKNIYNLPLLNKKI